MFLPLVTTTTTIIGWNFPSGTTFGNGLLALIFPLVGMGLFAGFPLILGRTSGDFMVTMALIGTLVGSLLAMLSFPTSANATAVPFGIVVISGVFLVLWLWRGGKG